jgi:hypothetical protein
VFSAPSRARASHNPRIFFHPHLGDLIRSGGCSRTIYYVTETYKERNTETDNAEWQRALPYRIGYDELYINSGMLLRAGHSLKHMSGVASTGDVKGETT